MNHICEKYKVLLIDDEEDIVDVLETVLKREGFSTIFVANNGAAGIEIFKKESPDIVLLDIMLPDIDGYEVYRELKRHKDVPILFISAKSEEVDRLLGFALGADDYITKPFSAKEVAFRLKARLKAFDQVVTRTLQEKRIIRFGDVEINEETGEVRKDGQILEFTAKEFKLLMYLVNNPNRIISKEMICNEVWGEDFFGYDNTITVHIRKLRLKIEENPSKPQYITTVIGLGYKFVLKGA